MKHTYPLRGTCAKEVTFEVDDGNVKNLEFYGGCPGNLEAISQLLDGMPVTFAIERLSGITCGNRSTSCSDQFAKALKKSLNPD